MYSSMTPKLFVERRCEEFEIRTNYLSSLGVVLQTWVNSVVLMAFDDPVILLFAALLDLPM